jgi:hypothetical protein
MTPCFSDWGDSESCGKGTFRLFSAGKHSLRSRSSTYYPTETMLKSRESYYLRYIGVFVVDDVGAAGEIAKVSQTLKPDARSWASNSPYPFRLR